MSTLPPGVAERLLRRLLRRHTASAEFVLGDLREEYAARLRRPVRARLWYAAQVISIPVAMRWRAHFDARRPAARRPVSRRSRGGDMRTELRQIVRFLVRRPGFSGAIVLTVALAIAATTIAFAVVDGVLLEPLPYREPDRLVVLWEHNVPRDRPDNVVSPANFLTWRERAGSFEELAAAVAFGATITGAGAPERVGSVEASASLFRMIGATPLAGRLYGEGDEQADAGAVAVLSEAYWRRRYGADPGVVGREILLGGDPTTIIGVLPARFDVPIAAEFNSTGSHDVWVPAVFPPEARSRTGRYLQVFARLRPEVTVERARAALAGLAASLREEFPQRQAGWDITVRPLREQITGDIRLMLLVIFGAVSFVLLIACGNVANLLLTRASARRQEMAVRSALGAGRGRLLGQLLLESAALSLTGGAVGLVLAHVALQGLMAAAPVIPRTDAVGLDASVIAFAFGATILTALLFGLAPALHIAGDTGEFLRDRGSSAGRRSGSRLRAALVVAQVALSLVLLVGAGLLLRSFANRITVGAGFDTDRLLAADVQLTGDYDAGAQARFFEELVTRVGALPGASSASAITFAPLSGLGSGTSMWPLDRPAPPPGAAPVADLRFVHKGYRDVIGIRLLEGRFFNDGDHANAPLRVVINESGARQLWPGRSATGERIALPWGDTMRAEVIGVVGDVLFDGPDTELRPMLYWDHRQFRPFAQMTLLVRAADDPLLLLPGIRDIIQEMDPDLPLYNVTTMRDLESKVLARPRFATLSLGAFAAVGLLLAAIGIYGVMAFSTQQRSREFGIRVALGADRGSVTRLVLSQAFVLVAIALVLGTAGALALTRLLQGLVFDISTTDPATFAAMLLLLAVVALVAAWLPARHAGRIDPVSAIRME